MVSAPTGMNSDQPRNLFRIDTLLTRKGLKKNCPETGYFDLNTTAFPEAVSRCMDKI